MARQLTAGGHTLRPAGVIHMTRAAHAM